MSIRGIIEDIMHDRRRGFSTLPMRFVLRIASVLYGVATAVRNFLYDHGRLRMRQVNCRVVGIGNVVAGGTGKTPVTIMTVTMLRDAGYRVAVVSRGYGRPESAPLVVSDGAGTIVSPHEGGDEPHLIASHLPDVPVVVGTDRYAVAELAYTRFGPEVIVLDDGMQHRRLYREADIVTMSADNPIGSEYLLPRGLLRESPFGIRRAKVVVVTRMTADHDRDRIERMIRYYDRNVPVFWARTVVVGLREPGGTTLISLERLRGTKTAALSNIADPSVFHRSLGDLGAEVVFTRTFPDHHRYTAEEYSAVCRDTRAAGADMLVMTGKDERNLPDAPGVHEIETVVLDIDAVLMDDTEAYLAIVAPKHKPAGTNT